ncbi:MAG: hypothetical protein ACRYGL_04530 [Janthinobacterium lividum]
MPSTTAQLDQYVLWISEHWDGLSSREREVMLSVGAAVFRQWVSATSATPAFSAAHLDILPEVVPVHRETGDAAASCNS